MNWVRVAAVVRLELQVQRREPLTVLYMLVFALLATAFAAAGPVELVGDRGPVPRDAPWSLMLASTAITAFGQVITTMVAATVVLRDRADRVADLLVATHLTQREYLLAKLLASLLMLALIYAAVPVGLIAGSLLGGGSLLRAMVGTLPPFVAVVLPTMLAVGALQFSVGVLSGRLWVIVGQGLLLIWLWTAAIGWVSGSDGASLAALLDPFGSAPLLRGTRDWSDAERLVRVMPLSPLLLVSRAVWMTIGFLAATIAITRVPARSRAAKTDVTRGDVQPVVLPALALVRAHRPHWWRGLGGTAHYVARWMLRDTGWRVLALLGAVNVAVHARIDGAAAGSAAMPTTIAVHALQEHSRMFLILLATIYAGELVWREREERSAAFFAAMPIADATLLGGRVIGVLAAQCAMVLLLAVAAAAGVAAGGGGMAAGVLLVAWHAVLLPFLAWMLLALAVHVLLQQKVVAHLVCIAGWAVASVHFGAATPAVGTEMAPWHWTVTCLLAVCVVCVSWTRAPMDGRQRRRRPVRAEERFR